MQQSLASVLWGMQPADKVRSGIKLSMTTPTEIIFQEENILILNGTALGFEFPLKTQPLL